MTDFTRGESCLMEFLQRELDDPTAEPCGRCAVCAGDIVARTTSADVVEAAVWFLRRSHQPIRPTGAWPSGLSQSMGPLSVARRASEGLVFCRYGDAGWGTLVKRGKTRDGRLEDALVDASAVALLERWPDPAPGWVTAVPSLRSELVPHFATRLATRLGLAYVAALMKIKETPPQKTMQNAYQQASNVIEAFRVDAELVATEPVLLVDDVVDSRWTLTVCAVLLRDAGSGPVHPFALADSSRRST